MVIGPFQTRGFEIRIRQMKLHCVGWCSFEPNCGSPIPYNVSNEVKRQSRWLVTRWLTLWKSLKLMRVTRDNPYGYTGDWLLIWLEDEINA